MSGPIIAITMGDPTGVGPEIIVKSLAHADLFARCRPLVIGDAGRLRQAAEIVGADLPICVVDTPAQAQFSPRAIEVIEVGHVPTDLPFGRMAAEGGAAAYRYIERAAALAVAGDVDAICTAPLNKEALHAAGHNFPGHTELLAHLTGTPEVSMMLVAPKLRVIHVTTHIGLIDAIARIDAALVTRTIERAQATLIKAGVATPRIGVCAINPPAGGGRKDRACRAGVAGARVVRRRATAGRHAIFSRCTGRFRRRGGDVSRSGPWPDQGDGHRKRREHYGRVTRGAYFRRSRHCFRYRRDRNRR